MFSLIYFGFLRNSGFHSQLIPGVLLQVLSGSGVYDGSEIHEASSILIHLTREGAVPQCYAPDVLQMHVIDHKKVFQYSLIRYLVYHHSLWFGTKFEENNVCVQQSFPV